MHCASRIFSISILSVCLTVSAQTGATGGEWRTYGGDLGNTRYSALDQINASNFNQLQIAWRLRTENFGPEPEYKFEATPLMANGVLYTTAGSRRAVVALDPATGEVLWMHAEHEGTRAMVAPRRLSGHGLAYWTDGNSKRILYVTPGYRLIALDAATGTPIPSFGKEGVVDLRLNDDQEMDLVNADIGLHSTPIVAGNTIIVGAAHRSGEEPRSKTNLKGYVRGFDVKTGKRLWIFHTIPRPEEFGYDTWEKGSAEYTGNTGVWAQISVDEDLGMVYLPVESPTQDSYGGDRPGNALFAESLVALDLKTGQRKWHYQLVHHGVWDFDIPCAPALVDITVDGKPVKALAQATKQSILYVLNRVTGEPVWPIVERPVPQGDVPGEWYSPTQPIPTKPPFYDRNGFTTDELIDFTPEMRAQARDVMARVIYGFRLSVLFGVVLTTISSAIGIAAGAVQGFYGGLTDLLFQRFIEIWNGMPQLYLLIILGSIIVPGFWVLLLFLLLFSWMNLTGVVRAEFLRGRNLDYVRAAKALGVSDLAVMWRHILPNAMVATLTFVPFILSGSVTILASLDFLGFGLPPGSPSLGELVAQGKNNLQAPWLGFTAFFVLGGVLTLLIFIGEAVRDAFDPRRLRL